MTFESASLTARGSSDNVRLRKSRASRLVERLLPALRAGRLRLVLPNGDVIDRCGEAPGSEATILLRRWRGAWRILLGGEHGFADGYIDGDWSTPDLSELLALYMHNDPALAEQSAGGWLTRTRNRLAHNRHKNTRRGSRRNIAAHYDLGNAFYREWLDRGMNYSSALYAANETLEVAQLAKLDRVACLLELKGGERVLEIGCGWGALAERLVCRLGCTVTGITLSSEQLAYADTRLAGKSEAARADLRLLDYRDVEGQYDRIASIEMLEAVGERYWPTYFDQVRSSLRDGGIAVLQVITIAEQRYAAYRQRPDFIQRHIFPGGMLPTLSHIQREAARVGLKVAQQESFGGSYARTLREWRSRFNHAAPKIDSLGFDQRFRRMWEYYLAYCEVGFRFGAIDVNFIKLVG
jgi:cyclopropane-fatty-acyl-phospholipid synthase